MSGILKGIFGDGGAAAAEQKRQLQSQRRTSLASLASQQTQVDQAAAAGPRKAGRGLLTFARSLSGDGTSTFG